MMGSNQVNISFVEEYSKNLAKQLADDYFIGKTTATGTDLINFCKFDQINLFAILELFEEWKKEISKIESPYFNYQAYEVKEALESFMNVLSRNIRVQKNDFILVLERAILNTILAGANIQLLFEKKYSGSDVIKTDSIKQSEKYYRINRTVVSSLIQRLEENNIQELSKSELLSHLAAVLTSIPEEEYINNDLLHHLTFLIPISEDQVYTNHSKPGNVEVSNTNFFSEITPQVTEPKVAETQEASEMKLIIKEDPNAEATDQALHEKYSSKEQMTLNDMLRNNNTTLAESVAKNKLLDIKSALTVNQKFMFINELFKGESWEFDNAIAKIGTCPDYESAINMLLGTYADKYHWDPDNEQVAELFELVSRKFYQS